MSGGLTNIKDIRTYKRINYRPTPFNRQNVNVGERSIVGIPYLRNSNFKPVDARISNTARLGQTSTLKDRRKTQGKKPEMDGEGHTPEHMEEMEGEGFFGDAWKGVKKGAKYIKKKRILSKTAGLVGKVASAAAPIATALGHPEIAAAAKTTGLVANPLSVGLKAIGLGEGEGEEQPLGNARGVRGNERMSFVATHPMNYRKARLATMIKA